jgi:hypothetical protein
MIRERLSLKYGRLLISSDSKATARCSYTNGPTAMHGEPTPGAVAADSGEERLCAPFALPGSVSTRPQAASRGTSHAVRSAADRAASSGTMPTGPPPSTAARFS